MYSDGKMITTAFVRNSFSENSGCGYATTAGQRGPEHISTYPEIKYIAECGLPGHETPSYPDQLYLSL